MTRDICKEYGLGVVGENYQGLEIRVRSVTHCLCMAQQTFLYQTFAFPSPCVCLPIEVPKDYCQLSLLSLAEDGI